MLEVEPLGKRKRRNSLEDEGSIALAAKRALVESLIHSDDSGGED